MKKREYYMYIMASKTGVLYIGVTNSLIHRVDQHKYSRIKGFTNKYKCTKLVYFETTDDVGVAISREKELKNWRRAKKTKLINSTNPSWRDLAKDWYGEENTQEPSLRSE
jgi:putative endonuclease